MIRPALYCIPTPLGGKISPVLPEATRSVIHGVRHFVAENAKSARAFLADAGVPGPMSALSIYELEQNAEPGVVRALLEPLRKGTPLGLISEAGCPAIADPGAGLVEAAHREGLPVVPLVGPSSIVLALMASGLEGQRFAFCGYLPRKPEARKQAIVSIERRSRVERETQIFIETPYRNDAMVSSLLATCAPSTRLCFASDLTLAGELVRMRTVDQWRHSPPSMDKRPTVFLLLAKPPGS